MADLTVVILTKNEEANLEKCITSLNHVAKRILVIDSFSTDQTVEIARSLGAEVIEHSFVSHAEQFNWAIHNISIHTAWIMKMDADEQWLPELSTEIEQKLDRLSSDVNGVILRRRVCFMGKWLRHGGKYPELLLRIFRTGHGMSEMKSMDEHLIVTDGKIITFEKDFVDNNNKELSWWISKHNWYSDKEVFDCQLRRNKENNNSLEQGRTSIQAYIKRFIKSYGYYRLPRFLRSHLYFIYRYYIRAGFLDGTEGHIYTFLQAYWYRFLVDAKMYECERSNVVIKPQGDLKV